VQLSTRRAALRGAIKKAIVADFKAQKPRQTLLEYKAQLLTGTFYLLVDVFI
jgi:hypothetical protein